MTVLVGVMNIYVNALPYFTQSDVREEKLVNINNSRHLALDE